MRASVVFASAVTKLLTVQPQSDPQAKIGLSMEKGIRPFSCPVAGSSFLR